MLRQERLGADPWGAVVDEWPSSLAYLVSFGTIGVVWLEHTVVTEYVDHATSALVRPSPGTPSVARPLPGPARTGLRRGAAAG